MPKGGFWDNPFGGLFDFNRDGKEDPSEQWTGIQMFEDAEKEGDAASPRPAAGWEDHSWRQFCEDGTQFGIDPRDYETQEEYEEALEEAKYGWRDTVEDGFEFGIDPEDYETQEEYEEALEEAKYGWRDTVEDGLAFGVDPEDYETEEEYEEALKNARAGNGGVTVTFSWAPEPDEEPREEIREADYPNKRQYQAAVSLAKYTEIYGDGKCVKEEMDRFHFILEQNGTVLAANYLTAEGDFLFAQAIKDHFDLPVTLPDEDEASEMPLEDILKKLQRKDVLLALKVWEWCVEQFLPYVDYSMVDRVSLTNDLLDSVYDFSEKFRRGLRAYLNEHADFRRKLVREAGGMPIELTQLIVDMIRDGYTETAKALFDDGLFRAGGKWKKVNGLMEDVIAWAKDYEELETMEFIGQNFLPVMKQYSDGMILDEVDDWQQEITEYIRDVERNSEKYAYSRGNAWRKHAPDGSEYGLDPRDYDTEQEYLDELKEAKYGWRKWVSESDTLGLDLEQFETEEEFVEAWQARRDEELSRQSQLLQQQREAEREKQRKLREERKQSKPSKAPEAELLKDPTIYTYCGVKLPFSERPYSFRTEDSSLKIGDAVIVPLGEENREAEGTVVSIGQYSRIGVPFPVERTKFILRKADTDTPHG